MNLLEISDKELGDVFTQTALEMGLGSPTIIEKDFWLVQILQILFSDPEFKKNHVFKGGTSLSKCFNLIQRFSEDLDITISRDCLGFKETTEEVSQLPNKKRKKYFDALIEAAEKHVEKIAALLSKKIHGKAKRNGWQIYIDQNDKQTIIFEYPRTLSTTIYPEEAYVRPKILLEFGCRGEMHPVQESDITCYVEEVFSRIFGKTMVAVNALSPERTFWEKITLLHMLAHQDKNKPMPPRMARHYYDVYKLTKSNIVDQAIQNPSLLESVALHKLVYFRSKQASYETAKPGSLHLVPHEALLKLLKEDYVSMNEMFFGDIMSFDEIMETLMALENNLNNL